ncbi:MAG: hypothetical protein B7Z10_10435, partial [Rhodobacterales bacterium 32-66-7]
MSAWGALGAGTRALILGSGAVLALGSGYLGWSLTRPAEVPVPLSSVEVAPPAAEPVTEDAAKAALPLIDTWRVAPDGEALVAGLAAPDAAVEVLVDGVTVASGKAAASGEFVLQFTLQGNDAPSLMTLAMTPPEGERTLSEAVVALGPIAGPQDLAGSGAVAEPADPETAAPAALLLTGDGAVVLQGAEPADPVLKTNVMIDTIAYTPLGEVQIGGRGMPGAGLRVYVDTVEKTSLVVPETGQWLLTLNDTPPGIYTLRVDQIDAEGKVTSRFETPFKRETLEELALVAGIAAPEPVEEPVNELAPDLAPEVAPDLAPEVASAVDEAGGTAKVDAAEVAEVAETVSAESVVAEPVVAKPVIAEPVASDPVAVETVAAEPVGLDPVAKL